MYFHNYYIIIIIIIDSSKYFLNKMFGKSKYNSLIIYLIGNSQKTYKSFKYNNQNLNTEQTDQMDFEIEQFIKN